MTNNTINDEINEMKRYYSEQLPNWEKATADYQGIQHHPHSKAPNLPHGCICLEAGILIDTFSPIREDFLK